MVSLSDNPAHKTSADQSGAVVVGLGKTGQATAEYFAQQGKNVWLWDTRDDAPVPPECEKLKGIDIVTGAQPSIDWACVSHVIVSPGIAVKDVPLEEAKRLAIPIMGDVELFAQEYQSRPSGAFVIGVTGSNGKTTVTKLIEHIIKASGKTCLALGNVGLPIINAVDSQAEVLVIELSSFQLETTSNLHLDVACYLNLSEDHLDRHGTLEAYGAAKQRIYDHAEHALYWADETQIKPATTTARLQHTTFSVVSDNCDWYINNKQVLCHRGKEIISVGALPLAGFHNVLNVLAAFAACHLAGVSYAQLRDAIVTFVAPPHRCVTVSNRGGVQWIDDSKATNPGATKAALKGIGLLKQGNLLLIAGGESKGADLSVLRPEIKAYVDRLVTIGRSSDTLNSMFNADYQATSLTDAVCWCANHAKAHDTVLLSPACASLDMFKNYEHRAAEFARAIDEVCL